MNENEGLISSSEGYRKLRSFQTAQAIYLLKKTTAKAGTGFPLKRRFYRTALQNAKKLSRQLHEIVYAKSHYRG